MRTASPRRTVSEASGPGCRCPGALGCLSRSGRLRLPRRRHRSARPATSPAPGGGPAPSRLPALSAPSRAGPWPAPPRRPRCSGPSGRHRPMTGSRRAGDLRDVLDQPQPRQTARVGQRLALVNRGRRERPQQTYATALLIAAAVLPQCQWPGIREKPSGCSVDCPPAVFLFSPRSVP